MIKCKAVNILTNQTTYLSMCSLLNGRLIADWSVENMNPDVMVTPYNVVKMYLYNHKQNFLKVQQTFNFN
jgi:hypothetical protein